MNTDEALKFARQNHRAVLATRRTSGGPQLSPIVTAMDDQGRVLISTREPSAKVRNIRRDPLVSLCFLTDQFFGGSAQIDGTAEIVSLPEAMPLLEQTYRQVAGEHPDWDDFRRAMVDERRVVLRITPSRSS